MLLFRFYVFITSNTSTTASTVSMINRQSTTLPLLPLFVRVIRCSFEFYFSVRYINSKRQNEGDYRRRVLFCSNGRHSRTISFSLWDDGILPSKEPATNATNATNATSATNAASATDATACCLETHRRGRTGPAMRFAIDLLWFLIR